MRRLDRVLPELSMARSIPARRHPGSALAIKIMRSVFSSSGACSTLAPALCARKETDIENLSTAERILAESHFMRGDFFDTQTGLFGFDSTSLHCIPRLSPRNSNLDEVTANNGAAENCSARHGSCYSYSGVSRSSHHLS